jgi:hypothetical protein
VPSRAPAKNSGHGERQHKLHWPLEMNCPFCIANGTHVQERVTSGDRDDRVSIDRNSGHGDRRSRKRKKSLASRLVDAFEEIIDL